jgi:hypothetical protein
LSITDPDGETRMRGPGTHHDPVVPAGDRTVGGVDSKTLEDVRRDAYQRGVADERARHKRNPLVSILIALCALLGIAVVALAVWKGSFSGAGQTLDQTAGQAAQEAKEAGREVADESGEALQDAGRNLEVRGEGAQQQQPAGQPAPQGQTPPPAQQ